MPRFADHVGFAQSLVAHLSFPQDLESRSHEFWSVLEVNAERIIGSINDPESVQNSFSSLGIGGLQLLFVWLGIGGDMPRRTADLTASLANYFVQNRESSECQTILLLNDFVFRRRADAIEAISRLLLPNAQFDLVQSSSLDINSKRLCYALLTYVQNPHQLQLLMLFESAERAGYTRYVLVPKMESLGSSLPEESADLARQHIEAGADLAQLSIGAVNDILDGFETRHGRRSSQCFDLFQDALHGQALVFVLRFLRESHIREVDGLVFAEEAELIVLRLYDDMRIVDEHSSSGIGVEIASAIASTLLGDPNVKYIEDTQLTSQDDLENLIETLTYGDDDRLRFQELYLRLAPIEEAPILILRCDKSRSLATPIEYLRQKDIDLLRDLSDIRNVKVTFVVEMPSGKHKGYVFKVFCEQARPGSYFLPYSGANISTSIRSRFEMYLRENYHVQVVPGTG